MPITYITHDNGGEPFEVVLDGRLAVIYRRFPDAPRQEVARYNYVAAFDGDEPLDETWDLCSGCSVLLKLYAGKYLFVGHMVYLFQTIDDERIVKFYSPVGNNDVPYPYAVGEKHTYFMLDTVVVPNRVLRLERDAYMQLYGHSVSSKRYQKIKAVKREMSVGLIDEGF